MAINMKAGKKMKGLMCQSHASTAVCMSQDQRSVIVPRSSVDRKLADNDLVNRSRKYIRLGELQGHSAFPVPAIRRSSYPVPVVSSLKKCPEKMMMPQQGVTPPTANSLALSNNVFQVVVMRVSIHCQGCAGKVKKHISKMEGVTSYSIDLESKRVTVMGHVSPSGVLESISKVKKAEFWPAC